MFVRNRYYKRAIGRDFLVCLESVKMLQRIKAIPMKKEVRIAVLLSSYNGEKYIREEKQRNG